MRRRCHTARRAHPGQTLVIFALAQLVLFSALGLAIDGGFLYLQRRAMQNAADAAALAGAQAIGQNLTDTAVTQIVFAAAARNGVTDPSKVTCNFLTNTYSSNPSGSIAPCTSTGTLMSGLLTAFSGVEVRVSERHQTFVLRTVGIPESGTAAIAAAQIQAAAGIQVGPFVVCAINTKVYSAPANFNGGIFESHSTFTDSGKPWYTRIDGYDNCSGYTCGRTDQSGGAPVINQAAYGYLDGALTPPKDNNGNNAIGPAFLIHDSNGITVCNDNSSSFKGINTNTPIVTPPVDGYWPEMSNNSSPVSPNPGAFAPNITTGNITAVQATVEGINGCKAGAALDNCIMILPIVDNSGPGGTGSNAQMAWRILGAFYIKEIANGSHTGSWIKNYPIVGDSAATWKPGSQAITSIKLIR